MAPCEEDWDAVERHLLGYGASRTGGFVREELEEPYGEGGFVKALEAET